MEQQPQQQASFKKEIFKERVNAGDRTYFFDVKETVVGKKYLTITESRKIGEKKEYSRILVFEEQISVFTEGFKKVYNFLMDAEKVV